MTLAAADLLFKCSDGGSGHPGQTQSRGSDKNKAFLNRWRSPRVSVSWSRACRLQEGPLASCLDHELLMKGLDFLTCLHLVFSRKFHCPKLRVGAQSPHSCLTLGDLTDYSPPGSSGHGDSPGKKLEWVTMPSSRGSSHPRNRTCVSCISGIAGGSFTH